MAAHAEVLLHGRDEGLLATLGQSEIAVGDVLVVSKELLPPYQVEGWSSGEDDDSEEDEDQGSGIDDGEGEDEDESNEADDDEAGSSEPDDDTPTPEFEEEASEAHDGAHVVDVDDEAVTSGDEDLKATEHPRPTFTPDAQSAIHDSSAAGEDGEEAEVGGETSSANDSQGDDKDSEPVTGVWVVQSTVMEDGELVDVVLRLVEYGSADGYRIYGKTVEVNVSNPTTHDSSAATTDSSAAYTTHNSSPPTTTYLTELLNSNIDLALRPQGDTIRRMIFPLGCPAHCNDGYLNGQAELRALIPDTTFADLPPYKPVCAFCFGRALVNDQVALRTYVRDFTMVDLGSAVDFLAALNPRRVELGYSFQQFDEREWGYLFDDMQSENEDDDGWGGQHSSNNDGFEHWEEAMDPNAGAMFHRASDAAIAALPEKTFAEVQQGGYEGEGECLIDGTEFVGETLVTELPCGHVYCASGCIRTWLENSNTCPKCRAKIPEVEVEGGVEGEGDVVDAACPEDSKEDGAMTDRDGDVEMSDTAVGGAVDQDLHDGWS